MQQELMKYLQVWFVDKATKMNPHLNYGQGIPAITMGRGKRHY